MKHVKQCGKILLIAIFWFAVWALAAWSVGKPLLFPSPTAVLKRMGELMMSAEYYVITARSLWNILSGILIAVLGGCILALLTSRIRLLRDLILPLMTVIKATPVASFIILALIWIGSASVPTLITVLIVLPVIWTNLDEGFQRIDPMLLEVTQVYNLSPWRRLRVLTLPSLKPYFTSACRTSLGLAWKAGIAAEIIAMPRGVIGTMIGESKLYIETVDTFAWTLTVILLSLAIEALVSALLRARHKGQDRREVTYAEHS